MDGDMFARSSQRTTMDWSAFNWWGLFFLLIGMLWLSEEMGWFAFDWSMMGPLALVFAGLMAFVPRRR